MRNCYLFFILLISLLLSSIAWATPATCPDTSAIIAKGLISMAQPDDEFPGALLVVQQDNYNTYDNWYFGIAVFGATSPQDAIDKANAALPTLAGKPLPIILGGQSACVYGINGAMMAVATIP